VGLECYKHPDKPATDISLSWSLISHLPVCEECAKLHRNISGKEHVVPIEEYSK